jgi:hypothetical protein
MSEEEKFTKHMQIWGLLRKVATPDRPWVFVAHTHCLFNTYKEACQRAIEYNTEGDIMPPPYLYKPVEVLLEVEMDGWVGEKP